LRHLHTTRVLIYINPSNNCSFPVCWSSPSQSSSPTAPHQWYPQESISYPGLAAERPRRMSLPKDSPSEEELRMRNEFSGLCVSTCGKLKPKRVTWRVWIAWKVIPSSSTLTATRLSNLPASLRNEPAGFPTRDERGSAPRSRAPRCPPTWYPLLQDGGGPSPEGPNY